jgi:hypothetical protein
MSKSEVGEYRQEIQKSEKDKACNKDISGNFGNLSISKPKPDDDQS